MITVIILGILTGLGVVAYGRHLKSGRLLDGQAFVATIQGRQELYIHKFGAYCDVSSSDEWYPAFVAGEPIAKAWSPPSTSGWATLRVRPDKGTSIFRIKVRASNPTNKHALFGEATTLKIPAQPTTGTPHPWYYIIAEANLDGKDPVYTRLYTTSARSEVVIQNEGQ